ncbi:MAG: hypothetical protein GY899_07815 [Verrucomicrobiaceae bacterium]|nr:hypothetical protein [Verrucomicrobiaceae bacterium]
MLTQTLFAGDPLIIDTQVQWEKALTTAKDVIIENGTASATGKTGHFTAKLHKSDRKRSATALTIKQSALWQNWETKPRIGPKNLRDAPVFLTMGPDNYWMFGRYGAMPKKKAKIPAGDSPLQGQDAKLEGFDVPLKATSIPTQFNAPGGLVKGQGGYHAWQSKDMVHWVHHGCVTPGFARWVTTAEQVDGKTFIYYDFPNDQDPHLFIDEDLTDGKPGKNMGIALNDPSHGSDCAVIRDIQGKFHIIFEDWSPINARRHSWDSPLAGHAVSPSGIDKFSIIAPAVDDRTKPTGKIAEYLHPHWAKEDPKRFKNNIAKYEVHEPEQNAYGDWAAISIGGQYYLFCDYHPANKGIRIAWFTSSSIDTPFSFCDEIGKGHPDPDIGFAEGRFYLVTQTSNDYVSPGPWVERIEARVGVDTDNDGKVNQWTEWTEVKETYDYIPGFSKQVKRTPASIDLARLPAGYAFHADLKISDTTENKSKPIIESLRLSFK